jgi:hypothetical protein
MELADLILRYISTFIWPVIIVFVLVYFKTTIRSLLDRIIHNSSQINLEFGGQKVSVVLDKEVVKGAIETAIKDSDTDESVNSNWAEKVANNTTTMLFVLPNIEQEDLEKLDKLYRSPIRDSIQLQHLKPSYSKLAELGLAKVDSNLIELTEDGNRIRTLFENSNVFEVLHKIGQSV